VKKGTIIKRENNDRGEKEKKNQFSREWVFNMSWRNL